METNQLTFEHICFKYKGNDNQLFTDLDVTMETGQVVGILGASGSGKTTLTEILLGQLKPTCQQFRILEMTFLFFLQLYKKFILNPLVGIRHD